MLNPHQDTEPANPWVKSEMGYMVNKQNKQTNPKKERKKEDKAAGPTTLFVHTALSPPLSPAVR